jgi:lycopene cyclase domain-containing protein
MTYAGFLALFLGLPIVIFCFLFLRPNFRTLALPQSLTSLPYWVVVLIHVFLAVAYTTPWDNYLVATGVWFYDPRLVTGLLLGWVPLEEYTFFVLQTILASLLIFGLAARLVREEALSPRAGRLRWFVVFWMGVGWLGAWLLLLSSWKPATYYALLLVWAIPPILLQVIFGGDILWRYRRLVITVLVALTCYLSLADSLAIRSGIWTISPSQSLGVLIGGVLPLEEFLFFMATTTLIVFGVVLGTARESRSRALALLKKRKSEAFAAPPAK